MSTMAISLPADLFHSRAVGSVAGMSGTGAGLGTIASTYLIGVIADRFSFTPILLVVERRAARRGGGGAAARPQHRAPPAAGSSR